MHKILNKSALIRAGCSIKHEFFLWAEIMQRWANIGANMNDSDKDPRDLTIKVPKGTIVKVEGHPVKLKESLYIKQVDDEIFKLDAHTVMDLEVEEDE